MSDFPAQLVLPTVLTSLHAVDSAVLVGSAQSAFAFPSANLALLFPFTLTRGAVAKRLACTNGGTASGNIDMGIYRDDLTLLVSKGSTAQAGTNATQFLDITDTSLGPGRYYMALVIDNVTGLFYRHTPIAVALRMMGALQMTTAFPLPSTITPDAGGLANAYLPIFGIEFGRAV